MIRTDKNYREGIVDFEKTRELAQETIGKALATCPLVITQGFIAGTSEGTTTTLGREGSDYSASILSYCLDAESMTIWKDVPGFLNADPKFFHETIKINKIPTILIWLKNAGKGLARKMLYAVQQDNATAIM